MKTDSAIYEKKSTGSRGMYVGTRVKIGKFPLYLGGGQSISNQAIVKTSDGQLYMTNRRLVFVGMKRNYFGGGLGFLFFSLASVKLSD